ncbi:dentin sialophosphoprotein-like [Rhipicephalus sanguineus]|uniref:dentin sialophosphoprotein-like n=1 Tax=Rhipicephalus sanguineus TaxID=34632 RepID=UPI0020C51A6A|nr:dentin sialophosphoprotein-like [Rhipicephalus sanguineus]
MSSSQPDNSEDQPHDSDSVEYSGGGGGVFPKRSGKLFLIVGLMSVVVVVIVFLIVGFMSHRDAAAARAHNAGPAQLAPGTAETCVNPCRSPHFFCHPASEKDEKGCFEPGCACFPEHCHKRCPPDQECVLGSPVDYRGCFRPNCKCGCISPCPFGKECAENSTRDERGCFQRGCICEMKCPQRCPLGYRCRQNSPKDIEGCFLYGCICEPVPVAPAPSNQTTSGNQTGSSEVPRVGTGSPWPMGDDKALAIGVDQDFNSSSEFRNNRLVITRDKSETVTTVSPQEHADHSAAVSGHVPSPRERRDEADGPSGSVNVSLDLHKQSISTEGSVTNSGGAGASDARDTLLQHSDNSSSTLSHGPSPFVQIDNASTTVSVGQSKEETSAGTLSMVNGNVSNGSVNAASADDGPKSANTSSPSDEQNDDDDDDDNDDVSGDDKAQNATLAGRSNSENSTREKSDDVGTIEGEQGPPRQGQDSTSKISEATLQATASTTSSQQADEGHLSSTAVDHHASASNTTTQGATEDQHPPRTAANDGVRK